MRRPQDREAWYESDDPDRVMRGAASRTALWLTLAVVFALALGAAIWGFRVVTSDARGRGDAVQIKNTGINRVQAQERFEVMYQNVIASDKRIGVFTAALKVDPADQTARTNLTGAITYCQQATADYDAEARKYTARGFRAADLPDHIDTADPATDCKGAS